MENKTYYQDKHIKIYNKDCRDMSELPDGSVQCVVTSPPYWGLRKYSGEQELIWGDNYCEHQWGLSEKKNPLDRGGKGQFDGDAIGTNMGIGITMQPVISGFCSLCGAWKGAYGLEPTPEMYIEHTIEILREIRRVLRKDGVVFWNIGDSYYGSGGDHKEGGKNDAGFQGDLMRGVQAKQQKHNLLKPKDLCLIPFRVAIAAQEDGWWVRSVIIWSKPNPMPESVTDRPTESHEYILMLTKSAKYYWDADAVREPYSEIERWGGPVMMPSSNHKWADNSLGRERLVQPNKVHGLKTKGSYELSGQEKYHGQDVEYHPLGRNIRTVWMFDKETIPIERGTESRIGRGSNDPELGNRNFLPIKRGGKGGIIQVDDDWLNDICPACGRTWRRHFGVQSGKTRFMPCSPVGRNLRSAWEFPTQPYPEAHFAVFPEKLPELCIKAATPEVGCCNKCGAPWERITRRESYGKEGWAPAKKDHTKELQGSQSFAREEGLGACGFVDVETLGWQPTCKCNADKALSIVLDPFMGAGTTLWVAKKLNRQAVGYEISQEYCELALDRNRQQVLI